MAKKTQLIDDSLVVHTEGAAMKLAHVSRRQLRYWAETGLVRPSVKQKLSPRNVVRLYGFEDLLALLVVAQLREQFSLQHVRRVLKYLTARGYEKPLTEVRFAVDGNEIYFQHSDGSWEGDRQPGQVVLSHVLALEPLRQRIRDSASAPRERSQRGVVERRRSLQGSKPVFAGTRTPIEALFPYLERRFTTEKILEAFPHLTRDDVRSARTMFRQRGAA